VSPSSHTLTTFWLPVRKRARKQVNVYTSPSQQTKTFVDPDQQIPSQTTDCPPLYMGERSDSFAPVLALYRSEGEGTLPYKLDYGDILSTAETLNTHWVSLSRVLS
jgi:hypothetical protein